MRICIVGQSDAIIGEGVLIRDYRLTHITFEAPYDSLDIEISELKPLNQRNSILQNRPFKGRLGTSGLNFYLGLMGVKVSK